MSQCRARTLQPAFVVLICLWCWGSAHSMFALAAGDDHMLKSELVSRSSAHLASEAGNGTVEIINSSACSGDAIGIQVQFGGSGPWFFVYEIDGVPVVQNIPLAFNPYTIPTAGMEGDFSIQSVTGSDGCEGTIIGPGDLTLSNVTATLSGGGSFCEGSTRDLTIDLTGTGPWTIIYEINGLPQPSITTATTPYVLTVDQGGLYSIASVSDPSCTGMASGTAQLNETLAPNAILSGGGSICAGQTLDLDLQLIGVGPWIVNYAIDGVAAGSLPATSSNFSFPVAQAGTYTLTGVQDQGGCPGNVSGSAVVEVRELPTAEIDGDEEVCVGETASLTIDFTGLAPWEFSYSDGTTTTTLTTSNPNYTLDVSEEGVYTLVNVFSNGCDGLVSGLGEVVIYEIPSATISGDAVICEGESTDIIFDFTGEPSWTISYERDGAYQGFFVLNSPTFSLPTDQGGTYTISLIESNNCVGSAFGSATVEVVPTPSAVMSGGGSICPGATTPITIDFVGQAPWTIQYLVPDGSVELVSGISSSPYTFAADLDGIYSLLSVSSQGCAGTVSGSASVNVDIAPSGTLSGGGTFCTGQPLALTVDLTGTGPFDIAYTIDGGPPITIDGVTSPYLIDATTAGVYALTSVVSNNCFGQAIGSALVTETAPPTATLSGGEDICQGSSTTLAVDFSGSGPWDLGYTHNGGPEIVLTGITDSPFELIVDQAGNYTLTSVSTSQCNGMASGSIDIGEFASLSVSVPTETCTGLEYTVSFTISGGDPASYSVSGHTGALIGNTFTSAPIASGAPYDLIVTDANDCAPLTVSGLVDCVCPSAASISGAQTLCVGESGVLTIDLLGTPPFEATYAIDGVAQPMVTIMTSPYLLPVDTEGTYTLLSMSDMLCAGSTSGSGSVSLLPPLTVTNLIETCGAIDYVVSFELSGGESSSYQISGDAGVLIGSTFSSGPIASGDDYTFTVTDDNGCESITLDGTVDCACPATAILSGDLTLCPSTTGTVDITLGGTAPWSITYAIDGSVQPPVSTTDPDFGLTVDTEGLYTLLSVSDALCEATVSGSATVSLLGEVEVMNSTETCTGTDYVIVFDIQGGDPSTYEVTGGVGTLSGGSFTSEPIASGTPYSFSISDANGCNTQIISGSANCQCPASAVISGQVDLCPSETGSLTIDLFGTGPWSFVYAIDGVAQPLISTADPVHVLDISEAGTYTLLEMADAVCQGAVSGSATVVTYEEVMVSGLTETCTGLTYVVSFELSGGDASTYGVGGDAGQLSGGSFASDPIPSGQAYTFSISDGNACNILLVSGTVDCACPAMGILSGLDSICPGEVAELDLTLTGQAPWTVVYSLDGMAQAAITTSDTDYTLSTTDSGQYELVSVSDALCQGQIGGSAQVVSRQLPSVSGQDLAYCAGTTGSLILDIIAEGEYSIDYSIDGIVQPPIQSTTAQAVVASPPIGSYSFTAINDAHCGSTLPLTLEVSELSLPTAAMSGGGTICEGNAADVSVVLGGLGPWELTLATDGVAQLPILTNGDLISYQVNTTSIHSVVSVTDALCTNTGTGDAQVTVLDAPSATISGDASICPGEEATVVIDFDQSGSHTLTLAIDGQYQAPITSSDNPLILTADQSATWTLVELNSADCPGQVFGQAEITQLHAPLASLSGEYAFCEGELAVIDVTIEGSGPWSIEYSLDEVIQPPITLGVGENSLAVTTSGTYRLVGISDLLCEGTAEGTAEVIFHELPMGSLAGDQSLCEGEVGSVAIELIGSAPWTIDVLRAGQVQEYTATTSPLTIAVDSAGLYTLGNITDAHCASLGQGSALIEMVPLPSAVLSGPGLWCPNESTSLTIDLLGTGPFEVEYSLDGVVQSPLITTDATALIPLTTAGQYALVSLSDSQCDGDYTGIVAVVEAELPTATLSGQHLICANDSVALDLELDGTGPWLIEYEIDAEGQPAITTELTEPVLMATAAGTYTILSVSDANCSSVGEGGAEVTFFPAIELSLSTDTTICSGGEATLWVDPSGGQAQGEYLYDWSNEGAHISSDALATVSPSSSNGYLVEVMDGCGIPYTGVIMVTVAELAPISISADVQEFCGSGMVNLVDLTPSQYQSSDCYWTIGSDSSPAQDTLFSCSDISYSFDSPGQFTIGRGLRTPQGCPTYVEFPSYVEVLTPPISMWSYSPEEPTDLKNLIQLNDESIYAEDYQWYIAETSEIFSTDSLADYRFPLMEEATTWTICQAVSNSKGCADTLCIPIKVTKELAAYIPTAFTPDADGLNDLFRPALIGLDEEGYSFRISDRWGHLVWETTDISAAWNGQLTSSKDYYSADEVYLWQVTAKKKGSSEIVAYSGRITLIR